MTSRVALIAVAIATMSVYVWRIDSAAGLVVDDAWYVVLTKALAEGQGFTLISSAVTPIMPVVPPGFPLILAGVFRVVPGFPENLVWLKSVSIASMAGVGLISYWYFRRHRNVPKPLAVLLATATVLTPAFVFLATSTVMAECVFTFAQLLAVFLLERSMQAGTGAAERRGVVLAGALAALTMLVRTAGIAAVLAGLIYLLKERRWRPALWFAATVVVCLTPWTLYSAAHEPTPEERLAHGATVSFTYRDLLAMRLGGDPSSGRADARDLVVRVADNSVTIVARDVGAIFAPALFRGPNESGMEVVSVGGSTGLRTASMGGAGATMMVSAGLSLVVGIGLFRLARARITMAEILVPVSIAMIVLVPASSFRYVLPLTPFLWLYLWTGLQAVADALLRLTSATTIAASQVTRIAMLCLVGLTAQDHAFYILMMRADPPPEWIADAREVYDLTDWMNRNLPPGGAVATNNPGLIYLLTGRQTISADNLERNWQRWKAEGIRYVVSLRRVNTPPAGLGYRLLYETTRRQLWVVEL